MSNINTLKVLNSEQSASPVACRFLRELTPWTRSAGSDITRMYGFVILASRASLSPLSLYMPECASINTGFKKKLKTYTQYHWDEFALHITNLKCGKASFFLSPHTHNVTSPLMLFPSLWLTQHN